MHEATFDDELQSDAIAKKHSTTSEAISVGVAMGARRVILTHFSQRYQRVPDMSALETGGAKLEDVEDFDGPSRGMDQPVDESTSPVEVQAAIDDFFEGLIEKPSQAEAEPQPLSQNGQHTSESVLPSASLTNAPAQIIASSMDPTPCPQLNDMKIGVAFDFMRVKVGDIIHLDKFTPALRKLYEETLHEAKGNNDVLEKEQAMKVEETEKRTEAEKADKARRGQIKNAKRKQESIAFLEKMKREGEEEEEKRKGEERAMEGVEVTEPVVEKMRAIQ